MPIFRTTRAVALPDRRLLSFARYGDPGGVPVVALHGGIHAHPIWRLADGAARRRNICLVAPDRPGYGSSTVQRGRRILDTPGDLAVLADALGLDDLAVVTVGGGAVYGLATAHCLQPRVRRLAIVAPAEAEPGGAAVRRLADAVRQDVRAAGDALLADRPLDRALVGDGEGRDAHEAALALAFADPSAAIVDARLRDLAWSRRLPSTSARTRVWGGSAYAWLADMDLVLRWLC